MGPGTDVTVTFQCTSLLQQENMDIIDNYMIYQYENLTHKLHLRLHRMPTRKPVAVHDINKVANLLIAITYITVTATTQGSQEVTRHVTTPLHDHVMPCVTGS